MRGPSGTIHRRIDKIGTMASESSFDGVTRFELLSVLEWATSQAPDLLRDLILSYRANQPRDSIKEDSSSSCEIDSLDKLERAHILRVIAEARTLTEAASKLGIHSTTLWRKRKRYGLE